MPPHILAAAHHSATAVASATASAVASPSASPFAEATTADYLTLIGSLLFVVFLIWLYFAPAMIASFRKHANTGAIAIVNLFLGWTFLGWVIALAWAFTSNVKPRP